MNICPVLNPSWRTSNGCYLWDSRLDPSLFFTLIDGLSDQVSIKDESSQECDIFSNRSTDVGFSLFMVFLVRRSGS